MMSTVYYIIDRNAIALLHEKTGRVVRDDYANADVDNRPEDRQGPERIRTMDVRQGRPTARTALQFAQQVSAIF